MAGARGWTLVELIMVLVIMGVLAAFVGPVLLGALTAYRYTNASVATYTKMRYALERMAREVREVRRDPSNTADYDISTMSATSLVFKTNDNDSDSSNNNQVTITFGGSNVTLAYTVPSSISATLTDQVNSAPALPCRTGFRYFQLDGSTVATSKSDIAFVEVGLTLTEGTNDYCNRIRVDLRNPQ